MLSKKWKLCPFGEQAEALRLERGMPKTELARRLGFTVSYYNYIIHGRNVPKQQKRILEVLRDFQPAQEVSIHAEIAHASD